MCFLILLAIRGFHLQEPIESLHAWRQCDTAHYIHHFNRDGIDLLNPAVGWMGGHGTLILEFPLYEALASGLNQVFGVQHLWARLLSLAFFLWGTWFLFLIVRRLGGDALGKLTVLIWMAMPLTQEYSRAIHIDLMAICFAHGMLWMWMQALDAGKLRHWLLGMILGGFAFLVKGPYAFYFLPLLFWWAWKHGRIRLALKGLVWMLIPVVLMLVWAGYAARTNAQAPDWDFLPGYFKFDDRLDWYFGTLGMRLEIGNWGLLGKRILFEILGWTGLLLGGLGLGFGRSLFKERAGFQFVIVWLAGVGVYFLLFFGLNVFHNYYQLPFTAPLAMIMAMGGLVCWNWLVGSRRFSLPESDPELPTVHAEADTTKMAENKMGSLDAGRINTKAFARARSGGRGRKLRQGIAGAGLVCLLLFPLEATRFAEGYYYGVNHLRQGIGKAVRNHTPAHALVIISFQNKTHFCFPHLHYYARRQGWPVLADRLSWPVVKALKEEGAQYLALARKVPPEGVLGDMLNDFVPPKVLPVKEDWKVYLYQLRYDLDKSEMDP